MASLDPALHDEFERVRDELSGALQALYPGEVHLFEHGMGVSNTRVLCTVDHAHLHLLPLPVGLDPGLDSGWTPVDGSLDSLRRRAGGHEYLYYVTPDRTAWMRAADDRTIASQHLRRMLAARLGRADDWDWRARPDAESADSAWRRFATS